MSFVPLCNCSAHPAPGTCLSPLSFSVVWKFERIRSCLTGANNTLVWGGSLHLGPKRWKIFGERRARMVVGRLLCFSQEVGAKVHQQANLVDGLKQMTGRENQHSPEH